MKNGRAANAIGDGNGRDDEDGGKGKKGGGTPHED
jgi:hypothetical protein